MADPLAIARLLMGGEQPPAVTFRLPRSGISDGPHQTDAYPANAFRLDNGGETGAPPQPPQGESGIPDRIKRRGAFYSALVDALGFGLPTALLKRAAPETGRALDEFQGQYPIASTAGSVAGFVGNPANSLYRALGDKVARAGYGLAAQGTADGATLAASTIAPRLVAGEDPRIQSANTTVPAAMLARFLMPKVPDSLLKRTAWGTVAGGAAQVPAAVSEGPMHIPAGMAVGAMYGAGLRPQGGAGAVDPMKVLFPYQFIGTGGVAAHIASDPDRER
jgi:hypothetical protein